MPLQDQLRARRDDRPAPPPTPTGTGGVATRGPRGDLLLAWLVILGPVLVVGTLLAARQRTGDLEARLVRDANELFARSHPRPVHVDARTPGAIGDAFARHLPPLDQVASALQRDEAGLERIRAVVAGSAPPGAVPAAAAAALDRVGPDLDALLAATRRERADFPATKDSLAPLDEGGWLGYQLAATLAGVRMRRALAAGDPQRALRDGLDALALGRDAAIARVLVGRMVGAAIVSRLTPPVSAAIDALPDARARRDALRRLRAIRDAIPPFSRTLADEITSSTLYLGDALPESVREALPPRARGVLQDGMRDTAWWQRLAIRDGWRALREAQDALIAAADLPDEARTAAFAAVNARLMRSVNPFAAIALPAYGAYARRADAATRRLDALVVAAAAGAFRHERRRWPESVAELAAAGELEGSEAARVAGAELAREDGGALSIRVPLPRNDDREAAELVIVLGEGARR